VLPEVPELDLRGNFLVGEERGKGEKMKEKDG